MSETALLEAATVAPTVSLADLILVRLLTAKTSLAPKNLRADLTGFFRRPPSAEQFSATMTELRGDGFVTPKGQRATDTGRARALQFLGAHTLPPKANWRMLKARYLVPRALGLSVDGVATTTIVGNSDKLAAFLLKRKLALPVGTGSTLRAVFEAIVCRELGYPDHATLASLRPALLGKAIGGEPVERDAETIVPRVLLNAPRGGLSGMREVALTGWVDGGVTDPMIDPVGGESSEPFDLEAFAHTVKKVARTCPTGRFGDNKVFISHVWKQLRDESPFAALGLDGFKDKLVEANRANLLTLSRADLVQLMDPADVRASETTSLTAVFHFILVEKD